MAIQERDNKELFRNDTTKASILYDAVIIAGAIAIAAGLSRYFSEEISLLFYGRTITYEVVVALLVSIPFGIAIGLVWVILTRIMIQILFINPIKAATDDKSDLLQVSGIMANALFSGDLKNTYLQLQTPDHNFKDFFNALRFSGRFIVSFLAIFYLVVFYILDVFPDHGENLFLFIGLILGSAVVSLLIVGLYMPIRLVTEDARILTQSFDGTFQAASINIYDYINRFLVVSGLIMGFNLIQRELYERFFVASFTNLLIIYAGFSLLIVIIISPAFFPAMLVYRNSHSGLVNTLRNSLAKSGIDIIKIDRSAAFQKLSQDEKADILDEEPAKPVSSDPEVTPAMQAVSDSETDQEMKQ